MAELIKITKADDPAQLAALNRFIEQVVDELTVLRRQARPRPTGLKGLESDNP